MEIKRLEFQKEEIEIRETYLDSDGVTRERTRKVMVPTGEPVEKAEKEKR